MVDCGKSFFRTQEEEEEEKNQKNSTRPFDTQPRTSMISSQNIAKVLISKQVSLGQSSQLLVVQPRRLRVASVH